VSSKQINLIVFGVAGVLCAVLAVILVLASGEGGSSTQPPAVVAESTPAATEVAPAEQVEL
jgi:hypothetical protein